MIIHLLAGCEPISRRGWKAASCCFSRNYPGTLKIRTWKILNSSLNTAISPRLKLLCLCCWMVVYGRRWLPWRSCWSSGTPSPPKVQVIHASNVILLWLHMSLWDDWSLKHTFSWKKKLFFSSKDKVQKDTHWLCIVNKLATGWLHLTWECQKTLQVSQITMSIFQPKNVIIFCSLNTWCVSSKPPFLLKYKYSTPLHESMDQLHT